MLIMALVRRAFCNLAKGLFCTVVLDAVSRSESHRFSFFVMSGMAFSLLPLRIAAGKSHGLTTQQQLGWAFSAEMQLLMGSLRAKVGDLFVKRGEHMFSMGCHG
jgi:hypothetical protein